MVVWMDGSGRRDSLCFSSTVCQCNYILVMYGVPRVELGMGNKTTEHWSIFRRLRAPCHVPSICKLVRIVHPTLVSVSQVSSTVFSSTCENCQQVPINMQMFLMPFRCSATQLSLVNPSHVLCVCMYVCVCLCVLRGGCLSLALCIDVLYISLSFSI